MNKSILKLIVLGFFVYNSSFAVDNILGVKEKLPKGVRCTPVVKAVHKVISSVINISTERLVPIKSDAFQDYYREYYGSHYYKQLIPLGSGVIIDSNGLILTNYHVVNRASVIHVYLWNGMTARVSIVAFDSTNDLVLLKINDEDMKRLYEPLQVIDFGVPSDLFLGESVITIGNPFGLGHSVATGVLSAKNRSFQVSRGVVFSDILQTDAAINPGNSGGPLINLDGQLIGLNLAIRRNSEGIGFAIPLSRLEAVLAKWLLPSRFSIAICGFTPKTILADGKVQVVTQDVIKNSPADLAGLKPGDQILEINGRGVERAIDISRILWKLKVNSSLKLKIKGKDDVIVKVGKMSVEQLVWQRLGVKVLEFSPALKKAKGFPEHIPGVIIQELNQDCELNGKKVLRGDVITRIGTTKITSVNDIYTALKNTQAGESITIFLVTELQGKDKRFKFEVYPFSIILQ